MNNIFMKNNNLTVEISTLGAEIQSLKKCEKEYIWEENPDIWDGHSPILFHYPADKFLNVYIH